MGFFGIVVMLTILTIAVALAAVDITRALHEIREELRRLTGGEGRK